MFEVNMQELYTKILLDVLTSDISLIQYQKDSSYIKQICAVKMGLSASKQHLDIKIMENMLS